jgi:hypothetical protein
MVVDMNIPTMNMPQLPTFTFPEPEVMEFNGCTVAEEHFLHEAQHITGVPIADFHLAMEVWGALFAGFAAKPVPVFNTNPQAFIDPKKAFMPGAKN